MGPDRDEDLELALDPFVDGVVKGRRRRGVELPRRGVLPESGGVGLGCDRDRDLDLPAAAGPFPLRTTAGDLPFPFLANWLM